MKPRSPIPREATIGLPPVVTTKRCDGGAHGHEVPMSEPLEQMFLCGRDGGVSFYCAHHSLGNGRLARVRKKVIARRGRAYWMLWQHRWTDGCTAPASWHTKAGECLSQRGLSVVDS